jgi:hypothetical protein
MTTLKAMKPVLYSTTVKKGIKKIQKTALYMDRMMESGWVDACLMISASPDFSLSSANRRAVWYSMPSQYTTPISDNQIKPHFVVQRDPENATEI